MGGTVLRSGTFYDYGDAPSSYGIVRHSPDVCSPAVYLGRNRPDMESNSNEDLTGDNTGGDNSNGDSSDENGISVFSFQSNIAYNIPVTTQNNTASDAYLNAWIDYDASGTFEPTEQVGSEVIVASGATSVNLSFTVPVTATAGTTKMRLRICPGSGDCNNPTGTATGGEIEDFTVTIITNFPPNAVADSNTVTENVTLNVSAANGLIDPNDTDADGDPLTVTQFEIGRYYLCCRYNSKYS